MRRLQTCRAGQAATPHTGALSLPRPASGIESPGSWRRVHCAGERWLRRWRGQVHLSLLRGDGRWGKPHGWGHGRPGRPVRRQSPLPQPLLLRLLLWLRMRVRHLGALLHDCLQPHCDNQTQHTGEAMMMTKTIEDKAVCNSSIGLLGTRGMTGSPIVDGLGAAAPHRGRILGCRRGSTKAEMQHFRHFWEHRVWDQADCSESTGFIAANSRVPGSHTGQSADSSTDGE